MKRLHIGGQMVDSDWELLNINPNLGADHVCDAKDLSGFPSELYDEVYASHILEHFDPTDAAQALREWFRVLVSGGKLYLSVPDYDVLTGLRDKYEGKDKKLITAMIQGGRSDQWDIHKSGWNKKELVGALKSAGFAKLEIVDELGVFPDCSTIRVDGTLISLNVIAYKAGERILPKNPDVAKETLSSIKEDVMIVMSMPRVAFTANMFALAYACEELGIRPLRWDGVFWEQGIENLLEQGKEINKKYVLAIDYDTWFTKWHVIDMYNLMQNNDDVDVAFPLQSRRGNKYPMSGLFEDERGDMVRVSRGRFNDKGYLQSDTGHFGLTFIRLSCLDKLEKPWFISKLSPNNDWHKGHKDADVHFWIKCKQAGIKVVLAKVWIGHMQLLCSLSGPEKSNFITQHFELNDILSGNIPHWVMPKSFKDGLMVEGYLPTEKCTQVKE